MKVHCGHLAVMTLHDWLRQKGRTDAWLAEQVGRHRATITKIRNGTKRPSIEVAAKIQRLSRNAVTAADYCTIADRKARACPAEE
jgi:DNA-binding XRE family transcriptional regulator